MRKVVVLKTDPVRPVGTSLDQAAEVLARGGLVVAPTETRYGLLARADRQDVLEKLYRVKKRDFGCPIALLIRETGEAGHYGYLNRAAEILAERFFPGPMTLVLASKQDWPPPRVVDGKIGLRCSSAPVIRDLLTRVDMPITATSANISGRANHNSVEAIAGDFQDQVSLYLDAGQLAGRTSTVVDCSLDNPRILREGAIARDDILRAVNKLYE